MFLKPLEFFPVSFVAGLKMSDKEATGPKGTTFNVALNLTLRRQPNIRNISISLFDFL